MSSYESILAGVEVSGVKLELDRLQDYIVKRWEELVGIDAKGQTMESTEEPRIVSALQKIQEANGLLKDIAVSRILRRDQEKTDGLTPDEHSNNTEEFVGD